MRDHRSHRQLDALLEELVSQAVERDTPLSIAEEARHATRDKLAIAPGPITPRDERRATAYFNGVLRRRVVRRNVPTRAAARFVAAAVVADLRASGRSGEDIREMLRRGWESQFPPDVIEETCLRLCG
jgi:hypothetical protein